MCIHATQDNLDLILTDAKAEILMFLNQIESHTSSVQRVVINVDAEPEKPSKPSCCACCLQYYCNTLTKWWYDFWKHHYNQCSWGLKSLLSDSIIMKIAMHTYIYMMDNIKCELPEWSFSSCLGLEVLGIIA
jgi:hypothetical protein